MNKKNEDSSLRLKRLVTKRIAELAQFMNSPECVLGLDTASARRWRADGMLNAYKEVLKELEKG